MSERQTDGRTDRQTDRQIDRQRQADTKREREEREREGTCWGGNRSAGAEPRRSVAQEYVRSHDVAQLGLCAHWAAARECLTNQLRPLARQHTHTHTHTHSPKSHAHRHTDTQTLTQTHTHTPRATRNTPGIVSASAVARLGHGAAMLPRALAAHTCVHAQTRHAKPTAYIPRACTLPHAQQLRAHTRAHAHKTKHKTRMYEPRHWPTGRCQRGAPRTRPPTGKLRAPTDLREIVSQIDFIAQIAFLVIQID